MRNLSKAFSVTWTSTTSQRGNYGKVDTDVQEFSTEAEALEAARAPFGRDVIGCRVTHWQDRVGGGWSPVVIASRQSGQKLRGKVVK